MSHPPRNGQSSSPAIIPVHYRVTALLLAAILFMEQMDATALATALPPMARSFGVPPLQLSLVVTSYLLSLAVFIPVSGALADRVGSRTLLRLAIGVFTLGSILCGMATEVWFLIAARLLQGVGGAMMTPVGRLVLIRSVPRAELVSAMSWVLVPAMVGPLVGPLFGGALATYLSWRWIFYLNVPLGIIGIVMTSLFVPQIKERSTKPFDWRGSILSAISLSSLIFGLEIFRHKNLPIVWAAVALSVTVIAALAYWRHAKTHPAPVLDLRLLRIPTFRIACTAGLMFRIAFGALPFLLPLLLQTGFGVSAVRSGFITAFAAVGALVMKAGTSFTFRRLGYRNTLIWNGIVCTLYLLACGLFRSSWPMAAICSVLLAGGMFRSLQYNAYGTLVYADIPSEQTAAAISFHSMVQRFSVMLGVALSTGILAVTMALADHDQPTLGDFTVTLFLMAGLALAAVPACLALTADAGAELSGHRTASKLSQKA